MEEEDPITMWNGREGGYYYEELYVPAPARFLPLDQKRINVLPPTQFTGYPKFNGDSYEEWREGFTNMTDDYQTEDIEIMEGLYTYCERECWDLLDEILRKGKYEWEDSTVVPPGLHIQLVPVGSPEAPIYYITVAMPSYGYRLIITEDDSPSLDTSSSSSFDSASTSSSFDMDFTSPASSTFISSSQEDTQDSPEDYLVGVTCFEPLSPVEDLSPEFEEWEDIGEVNWQAWNVEKVGKWEGEEKDENPDLFVDKVLDPYFISSPTSTLSPEVSYVQSFKQDHMEEVLVSEVGKKEVLVSQSEVFDGGGSLNVESSVSNHELEDLVSVRDREEVGGKEHSRQCSVVMKGGKEEGIIDAKNFRSQDISLHHHLVLSSPIREEVVQEHLEVVCSEKERKELSLGQDGILFVDQSQVFPGGGCSSKDSLIYLESLLEEVGSNEGILEDSIIWRKEKVSTKLEEGELVAENYFVALHNLPVSDHTFTSTTSSHIIMPTLLSTTSSSTSSLSHHRQNLSAYDHRDIRNSIFDSLFATSTSSSLQFNQSFIIEVQEEGLGLSYEVRDVEEAGLSLVSKEDRSQVWKGSLDLVLVRKVEVKEETLGVEKGRLVDSDLVVSEGIVKEEGLIGRSIEGNITRDLVKVEVLTLQDYRYNSNSSPSLIRQQLNALSTSSSIIRILIFIITNLNIILLAFASLISIIFTSTFVASLSFDSRGYHQHHTSLYSYQHQEIRRKKAPDKEGILVVVYDLSELRNEVVIILREQKEFKERDESGKVDLEELVGLVERRMELVGKIIEDNGIKNFDDGSFTSHDFTASASRSLHSLIQPSSSVIHEDLQHTVASYSNSKLPFFVQDFSASVRVNQTSSQSSVSSLSSQSRTVARKRDKLHNYAGRVEKEGIGVLRGLKKIFEQMFSRIVKNIGRSSQIERFGGNLTSSTSTSSRGSNLDQYHSSHHSSSSPFRFNFFDFHSRLHHRFNDLLQHALHRFHCHSTHLVNIVVLHITFSTQIFTQSLINFVDDSFIFTQIIVASRKVLSFSSFRIKNRKNGLLIRLIWRPGEGGIRRRI